MSLLEAIILGIIQGLTEFLPVSSSGHIELGKVVLGVQMTDNLLFSIIVHGATALSTIVIFRKEIVKIISGLLQFKLNDETVFAFKILLSIVPVGLVYLFFEKHIEAAFTGQIVLVGSMLLVTATLLTFTYFKKPKSGQVNFKQSFIIGIAQAIAILPGISRSGATISTALLLGIEKDEATRFSFLMVLPPILGATLLEVLKLFKEPVVAEGIAPVSLVAGFLAAFLAGLVACSMMIKIVRKGKLIYFAIYCLIVGSIAVGYGLIS